MNKPQENDEDDYRESEDEDYNPEVEKAQADEGSDDDKADESFAELQGSGGLVKTRAQRRAEAEAAAKSKPSHSKNESVVVGTSGVDVEALWNEMNSTPPTARPAPPAAPADSNKPTSVSESSHGSTPEARNAPQEEYITIKRTFKFAGDVKTETKQVLKSSAEGQDYLRQQKAAAEAPKLKSQGRGPVKRKMSLMEEYQKNKTKKINTLEKSRLDWLGFVDKEGIREDLTKHNKSGYLDKQDFLTRADLKAEQELRQQRIKRMQQN